jgi:hypothetical protein
LRVWKSIETLSSASNGVDSDTVVAEAKSVSVKGSLYGPQLDLVALAGNDRVVQPAAGMSTIG